MPSFARALSWELPARPTEGSMPASSRAAKSVEHQLRVTIGFGLLHPLVERLCGAPIFLTIEEIAAHCDKCSTS